MSNNIIFNKKLEEYNKKYRNGRYKLLKYTKKEVENFDKLATNGFKAKNYLLNGRKWALIGDTYYEIPKAPRGVWFRNLNAGVQAATCLLGAGVVGTAVAVPTVLLNNTHIHEEEKKDESIHVDYITSKGNFIMQTNSSISYDAPQIGIEVYPLDATNKNVKIKVTKGDDVIEADNESHVLYAKAAGDATIKIEAVDNKNAPEAIEVSVRVCSPYVQISSTQFANQLTSRLDMCKANIAAEDFPNADDFETVEYKGKTIEQSSIDHIETNVEYPGSLYIVLKDGNKIPYNAFCNENVLFMAQCYTDAIYSFDCVNDNILVENSFGRAELDRDGNCLSLYSKQEKRVVLCCVRARRVEPTKINKAQFIQRYLNYCTVYKNSIAKYDSKFDIDDLYVYNPETEEYDYVTYLVKSLNYGFDKNNNPSLTVNFYDDYGIEPLRVDTCLYDETFLNENLAEDGTYFYDELSGKISYQTEGETEFRHYLEVNKYGYIVEDDYYEIDFCTPPYNSPYMQFDEDYMGCTFKDYLQYCVKTFLADQYEYYPFEIQYTNDGKSYNVSFVNYEEDASNNRLCKLYNAQLEEIDEVGSAFIDDAWIAKMIKDKPENYYFDVSNGSLIYNDSEATKGELRTLKISKNGYIEDQFIIPTDEGEYSKETYRSISYYGDPHIILSLSKYDASINVGSSFKLKATVKPSGYTDEIVWSTSDPNVATVEKQLEGEALVTGVGQGTATITATLEDIYVTCTVTVGEGGEITYSEFVSYLKDYYGNYNKFRDADKGYDASDLSSNITLLYDSNICHLTDISYDKTSGACLLAYYIDSPEEVKSIAIDAVNNYNNVMDSIKGGSNLSFRILPSETIVADGMDSAGNPFHFEINKNGYMEGIDFKNQGSFIIQYNAEPHSLK